MSKGGSEKKITTYIVKWELTQKFGEHNGTAFLKVTGVERVNKRNYSKLTIQL